jgi:hypothetical protein
MAARAHAELLARSDLQFDFPSLTTPVLPGWLQSLVKWIVAFKPALQTAGWIALACAGALLIWFLGRKAWRYCRARAGDGEVKEPAVEWRPAPLAAKLLLNDADALAMAGRYGEAAHLLLLRGIQDIAERNPALLRPALTSREIGALQQLPQIPRSAFARIAQIVELAFFAERAVGADDFNRCRAEYERFAFPAAWSAEAAR